MFLNWLSIFFKWFKAHIIISPQTIHLFVFSFHPTMETTPHSRVFPPRKMLRTLCCKQSALLIVLIVLVWELLNNKAKQSVVISLVDACLACC